MRGGGGCHQLTVYSNRSKHVFLLLLLFLDIQQMFYSHNDNEITGSEAAVWCGYDYFYLTFFLYMVYCSQSKKHINVLFTH